MFRSIQFQGIFLQHNNYIHYFEIKSNVNVLIYYILYYNNILLPI